MNLSIQFWGTSDAQGVPRMMCTCQVCASNEKRNVRSRPNMLVMTVYGSICMVQKVCRYFEFARGL